MVFRAAQIVPKLSQRSDDDEASEQDSYTYTISASSEEPYKRGYYDPWIEVLGHDEGEVDLSRANNGAPVLLDHNSYSFESRIGMIKRAYLEDKKLMMDIQLSSSEHRAATVGALRDDIAAGLAPKISVGYQPQRTVMVEENDDAPDVYRVTRWQLHEVSVVNVPADDTVGFGRDAKDEGYHPKDLLEVKQQETTEEPAEMPPETMKSEQAVDNKVVDDAVMEAKRLERDRKDAIKDLFKAYPGNTELLAKCLDDENVTRANAAELLLAQRAPESEPEPTQGSTRVEMGEDWGDKFTEGATRALEEQAAFKRPSNESEFSGKSLLTMARMYVDRVYGGTSYDSDRVVMQKALGINDGLSRNVHAQRAAMSTCDFPYLINNICNKTLRRGYNECPDFLNKFARRVPLTDLKPAWRVSFTAIPEIECIPEGGEYPYSYKCDDGLSVQLAKWGTMCALTMETLMCDDMGVIARGYLQLGRALKRNELNLGLAAFMTNPTMQDGVKLFDHDDHRNNNYDMLADPTNANNSTAGVLGVQDAVASMRYAQRTQKIPNSEEFICQPLVCLLAPVAMEYCLEQYFNTPFESAPGSKNELYNPLYNACERFYDPRIDQWVDHLLAEKDVSTRNTIFKFGDPDQIDTVETYYLSEQPEPKLQSKEGWCTDGIEFKATHFGAAAPIDHRGMQRHEIDPCMASKKCMPEGEGG